MDCCPLLAPEPSHQGIQTREEISWHKGPAGPALEPKSVALAVATTERSERGKRHRAKKAHRRPDEKVQ
jgi:hypothetical protein